MIGWGNVVGNSLVSSICTFLQDSEPYCKGRGTLLRQARGEIPASASREWLTTATLVLEAAATIRSWYIPTLESVRGSQCFHSQKRVQSRCYFHSLSGSWRIPRTRTAPWKNPQPIRANWRAVVPFTSFNCCLIAFQARADWLRFLFVSFLNS